MTGGASITEDGGPPESVVPDEAELDKVISFSRKFQVASYVLFSLLLACCLIFIGYLLYQHSRQNQVITDIVHQSVSGSCSFYKDVGTAPVSVSGPGKSTPLGVKIVVDARNAYLHTGCARSQFSAPSPQLRELARQYRIQLDG